RGRTTGHEAPHSSALPPLSAVPSGPVSPPTYTPVVQKRSSPWPWIAVGAVATLVIGGSAAYALWPDRSPTSVVSGSSSAPASISTTSGSVSPGGSTSTATATVLPDARTAATMVALLNDDLVHHKAFTDA